MKKKTEKSTLSKEVSIILPTFNEAGNVVKLIELIERLTKNIGWKVYYLVVDDDSKDETQNLVKKIGKKNKRVRLIVRKDQRGLATAALRGFEYSKTEYTLFMAADFNHDPKYVPEMLKALEANPSSLVNGSRYLSGGGMYSWINYFISGGINRVGGLVLGTPATDFTGVFLVAKTKDVLSLPVDWVFRGHGEWGIRLLYLLSKKGVEIVEIPVVYPPRVSGESKTKRLTYAWPLISAFWQTRFGKQGSS